MKEPQEHPVVLDDALSADDWSITNRYLHILKPLQQATVKLQGHIGGKFGCIWHVIPVFEDLLDHLEAQAACIQSSRPQPLTITWI